VDLLDDPALGAGAIVGLVQADILVGAAGGGAQVAQAPGLAVLGDDAIGVFLARDRYQGPHIRLVRVDVHTVGQAVGGGARLGLLDDHVALAQRLPARLGIIGGHRDDLIPSSIRAANCLEHPLLPLGAVRGGAEHGAHGVAVVGGAGARGASAVQVAQEIDCRDTRSWGTA